MSNHSASYWDRGRARPQMSAQREKRFSCCRLALERRLPRVAGEGARAPSKRLIG